MEYKNIICPVDGSELGAHSMEEAAYISKISGAKLILLNVVEKWYRSADVVTDSPEWEEIHEKWLDAGRELLKGEEARLKKQGVKNIETILRDGDAAHEIIALAMERRADLIVMASHRYSPVGKFFMGSIIDRVSKKSPCPVLWVFK
ncbi:MAG: universal stress protein [Deltaproteobacteria bacterium]|nr:universal stress protein [Deltaproteobacteria bacterium]